MLPARSRLLPTGPGHRYWPHFVQDIDSTQQSLQGLKSAGLASSIYEIRSRAPLVRILTGSSVPCHVPTKQSLSTDTMKAAPARLHRVSSHAISDSNIRHFSANGYNGPSGFMTCNMSTLAPSNATSTALVWLTWYQWELSHELSLVIVKILSIDQTSILIANSKSFNHVTHCSTNTAGFDFNLCRSRGQ
jgi:hypothetical protein